MMEGKATLAMQSLILYRVKDHLHQEAFGGIEVLLTNGYSYKLIPMPENIEKKNNLSYNNQDLAAIKTITVIASPNEPLKKVRVCS